MYSVHLNSSIFDFSVDIYITLCRGNLVQEENAYEVEMSNSEILIFKFKFKLIDKKYVNTFVQPCILPKIFITWQYSAKI